ncbi:DUF1045 domain-containing protein [Alphaproteobacteria bacterium KMM 3653]|uniref:DUF1045 domain-containing protein n=1 Tax=Harenicola maris TaxID=2841044 RepID=A0AAP2CN96_9RHOB|nr:DUF1045 domain-containing protein [Harenicola maris]
MFERYAVFFTPQGPLAEAGAEWLGWNIAQGRPAPQPDLLGLDAAALTATPRRYGMHGTIKPPFFLAEGQSAEALRRALGALCADAAPVSLRGMEVSSLGHFIALTPTGESQDLAALAARVVTQLDSFRAPPSAAELARRRQATLTPAQEANLARWGYPYVLDQFRFHITLTGRIEGETQPVQRALQAHFEPHLPRPFPIATLTLTGQDADGMFHEVERFALGG